MSSLSKAIPSTLKELRFHLCQTSPASAGLRSYINSNYLSLKAANPDLKVLIREAAAVSPRAFARFEQGVESEVGLANLTEKDVVKQLETLVKSSENPL
ncbi:NADH:ubiquinone oxidoreductase NDUFA2/B8 subunit [Phaffia rhodozyma]|uniref:NADH:ubiquinone oxidoreductase NDUFA2/B8 subunit n=1 Tax=Phaffia rhodozyma TaxID=264483 RepID=A0A0F7SXE0_PHARH|nr:NADH:ubiquinone oxidoreductase NDUFA2/B8 subunit [Phaffia rhodozyma]